MTFAYGPVHMDALALRGHRMLSGRPTGSDGTNSVKVFGKSVLAMRLYDIYIYIERERERERENKFITPLISSPTVLMMVH